MVLGWELFELYEERGGIVIKFIGKLFSKVLENIDFIVDWKCFLWRVYLCWKFFLKNKLIIDFMD